MIFVDSLEVLADSRYRCRCKSSQIMLSRILWTASRCQLARNELKTTFKLYRTLAQSAYIARFCAALTRLCEGNAELLACLCCGVAEASTATAGWCTPAGTWAACARLEGSACSLWADFSSSVGWSNWAALSSWNNRQNVSCCSKRQIWGPSRLPSATVTRWSEAAQQQNSFNRARFAIKHGSVRIINNQTPEQRVRKVALRAMEEMSLGCALGSHLSHLSLSQQLFQLVYF